ncbi:MAG: DNA-directed RNA polymerase subunit beta [Pseudomonadota bacterium]
MAESFTNRWRIRKSYERIRCVAEMPDLVEIQKRSYEAFLQQDVLPEKRAPLGLQAVFQSVFPIKDFSGRSTLEFFKYEFDEPKYDVEECQQRGMTYGAPLRVTFRLVVWDLDEDSGAKSIRDIKEQPVYVGDLPLMTGNGTFIINGIERVVVSQMHRSPGVFFDHDRGKTHMSGKYLFSARVIPYRGSWLDFEFDAKDVLYVRIDRRRKIPVTTLLLALAKDAEASKAAVEALEKKPKKSAKAKKEDQAPVKLAGLSREELLSEFYEIQTYTNTDRGWKTSFDPQAWCNKKLSFDLANAADGKVLVKESEKISPRLARKLASEGVKEIIVPLENLLSRYSAEDIINEETGEVLVESADELTQDKIDAITEAGIGVIKTLGIDYVNVGPHLRNTLAVDRNTNREEALLDIYRVMRPGEPPTLESAELLFQGLFFETDRYDLSAVGRVKMNARLGFKADDTVRILRREDLFAIVKALLDLKDGRGEIDDIDNLANRRVRSVGELMENQYRVGLLRMERAIRERMSSVEIDTVMPHDLINSRPVVAAIREFFGSSQLSQFMDQTNPLSEITHKRRLSALGPGGLTRERAGFEVRDVHPTHYGRICPIETPEGQNIGLINSLATFARVNKYGFIESPYRKVVDGCVTDEVLYLSAIEEGRYTIAQANSPLDSKGQFKESFVSCRKANEFTIAPSSEIDLMDVSPKQLVSVAASLIPFLENDDANRALMGSNMQRQAVPLLKPEAPLVGTGMEFSVAKDSGVAIVAKRGGVVDQVESTRVVVHTTEKGKMAAGVDIYNLKKFQRSNHSTCITQRPLVRVGDVVKTGDVIADGPATEDGELALGRNVLISFLSWNGYNFEDSIIISDRIVRDDVFTSIHIEEFEVMARDTKLGQEDITRDIPNVSDESLRNLDETGVVAIGAQVKPGDILVGKVTPKGESPMTPEEKLLRAIFGEKAADVRDSSLRLPPGATGTIVDVRIFSRRGIDKDERAVAIENAEINRLANERDVEQSILERSFFGQIRKLLLGQVIAKGPKGVRADQKIGEVILESIPKRQWRQFIVKDDAVMVRFEKMIKEADARVQQIQKHYEDKVIKIRRGDELMPGVLKMVKVFVAVKRKLQPGDKMAGRHGNKGVVSTIVPVEDMPHLEDGRPVDVILNPLGIPSRMNVGQILEAHMGWATAGMGQKIGDMLAQVQKNAAKPADLKKLMNTVYTQAEEKKRIEKLDNKTLMEVAEKLMPGVPIATPVFDGAREEDVNKALDLAGLDCSGQVTLIDGKTGEPFSRKVTVGYMYILKLHHLVDDKIHARSVGPYSLVTQQPLGGKAQFGGQRFGEMEVWALEAYGAAYTLQEMLTVKSDDVAGRTKVYESIVRGDAHFETGIPESFNVLVKELRALGINMEFHQTSVGKNIAAANS